MKTFLRLMLLSAVALSQTLSGNAAQIVWDGGGGDKSWHNPLNWAGDILPGEADEVSVTGNDAVLEVHSAVVVASLNIGPRNILKTQGPSARFEVTGIAILDGAGLQALDSGAILLPGLARYDTPEQDYLQPLWRADGAGSVLELPNLASITGSSDGYRAYLSIQAVNGGQVLLPKVTNISDPPGGRESETGIHISSQGFGSLIELPLLTVFADSSGSPDSKLEVVRGGMVNAPKLTNLRGVWLTLDDPAALPLAQIKQIIDGGLRVNGVPATFAGLTSLSGTKVVAEGAFLDMPAAVTIARGGIELLSGGSANVPMLSNADGSFLKVSSGVRFALPGLTRYDTPEQDYLQPLWSADGAGSVLELPNLASITGSSDGYRAYLSIQAVNGGQVLLPKVTNISDPPGGRESETGIHISSQGFGSLIELPLLTVFADNSTRPDSKLATWDRGAIVLPSNTRLQGINQEVELGSLIPPGDFDGDGLSNFQEYLLGTNRNLVDTDDDGIPDLVEVTAGTNPLGNQSQHGLTLSIHRAAEVQIRTKVGVSYQLQSSTDLVNWSDYGASIPGDGNILHWFTSVEAEAKLYFRLKP